MANSGPMKMFAWNNKSPLSCLGINFEVCIHFEKVNSETHMMLDFSIVGNQMTAYGFGIGVPLPQYFFQMILNTFLDKPQLAMISSSRKLSMLKNFENREVFAEETSISNQDEKNLSESESDNLIQEPKRTNVSHLPTVHKLELRQKA